MATVLPNFVIRGERARLFPVLAENSKEGRTLSIFLACMENVGEFGRCILESAGQRFGTRAKIETYTEVVLQKTGKRACRPDGLILVKTGSRVWSALVEAKVGNSDLTVEQVEDYLELAKLNGVDALITLSNQFAALPSHHPLAVSSMARRRAELVHWSWMYVLTEASVLLGREKIEDRDQRTILHEMVRFLSHPSTGVKSFDQMPASWSDVVSAVQAGGPLGAGSPETREVIGAWHQQVRDLSLDLSRQLNTEVHTRISRAHASDPHARAKADAAELAKEKCLRASLLVPDAASPIEICADLQRRSISVSMWLRAPQDRKSTKARLNWLLRQLQKADIPGLHVRFLWPGRAVDTQHSLGTLRDDPDCGASGRPDLAVQSFEVLLVRDLGARFGQRRNFGAEIKDAVPAFYMAVGQHLSSWQAPAPKLPEDRAEVETVSPEAIQEQAEGVALARSE